MEKQTTIGFIPMELEEGIMIISKRHNIKFKDVLGILNALVDAEITMEDLKTTPSKSGSAYQNKLERKTLDLEIELYNKRAHQNTIELESSYNYRRFQIFI